MSRDGYNGPSHMASRNGSSRSSRSRNGSSRGGAPRRNVDERGLASRSGRARREPLNDNYYYEETPDGERRGFQDVSSYSSPSRRRDDRRELERQQGKKKLSRGKKAAIITALALVLLIGGGCWYVFGYMLGGLSHRTISKDPSDLGWDDLTSSGAVASGEDAFQVVLDDKVTNIAMFGVDARDDSFQGRSDVVMILTIDNKHDKIKMTSIARDTCVDVSNYGYDKITHAYFYGGEEGAELAINTLNRNFHLRIEDYVTVNFARMAEIIDAVGGVELELTADEIEELNKNLSYLELEVEEQIEQDKYNGTYKSDDDYPQIVYTDYFYGPDGEVSYYSDDFKDGTYWCSGNRAVAYGRIRYIGNDDARMGRQQNVLKALIKKVKGMNKLEYPEMIRKIMPMCETSLDFGDITSLLPIIFTDFEIETMTFPIEEVNACGGTLTKNGGWVYLYDLEAAAKHISSFIYESDSPYYNQEIVAYTPYYEGVVIGNSGDYDVQPPESEPDIDIPVSSSPSESSGLSSEVSSGVDVSSDPSSGGDVSSSPSSGGDVSSDPNGGGEPTVDPSGGGSSGGGEPPVSTTEPVPGGNVDVGTVGGGEGAGIDPGDGGIVDPGAGGNEG